MPPGDGGDEQSMLTLGWGRQALEARRFTVEAPLVAAVRLGEFGCASDDNVRQKVTESTESSRTHVVDRMVRADLVARLPESKLFRPAIGLKDPSAQREKTGGASRLHTHSLKIGEIPDDAAAAFFHDATRGDDTNARNPQQRLERRRHHVDRKFVGMGKCPRDFGIHAERQIAVALVDEVLFDEPVVTNQIVALIETLLAKSRRRGTRLERRFANGTERREMNVMYAAARVELGDALDDGAIGVGRRTDDELRGHSRHAARAQRIAPASSCFVA